jgi:hypothetical protein
MSKTIVTKNRFAARLLAVVLTAALILGVFPLNVYAAPFITDLYSLSDGVFIDMENNQFTVLETGKTVKLPDGVDVNYPPTFMEGLLPVRKEEKLGFMDRDGNIVIDFLYDKVYEVGNYYAYAPISYIYKGIAAPRQNMLFVKKGENWGAINPAGEVLFNFEYSSISPYTFKSGREVFEVMKNKKNGLLAQDGSIIAECVYDTVLLVDEEGSGYDRYLASKDGVSTLFDMDGNKLIEYPYGKEMNLMDFDGHLYYHRYGIRSYISNGPLPVSLKESDDSETKYGVIDAATGNLIADFVYDMVHPFREGLAVVKQGDNYGFLKEDGNMLTDLIYETVIFFGKDDITPVKQDGKYGFLKKDGSMLTDLIYEDALSFTEGFAMVKQDGKAGFIDTTGTLVIPFDYDTSNNENSLSYRFRDGLAHVCKEGKWGVINSEGQTVLDFSYDSLTSSYDGLTSSYNNGNAILAGVNDENGKTKYQLLDKTGNFIADINYADSVYEDEDGTFYVSDSDSKTTAIIGADGSLILDFLYYGSKEYLSVPPTYKFYENGLSRAQLYNKSAADTDGDPYWTTGLINKSGEVIVPFKYSAIFGPDPGTGKWIGVTVAEDGSTEWEWEIIETS